MSEVMSTAEKSWIRHHLIAKNSLFFLAGQYLRLQTEGYEIIKYEENKERYVYQCIAVGGIYKYQ